MRVGREKKWLYPPFSTPLDSFPHYCWEWIRLNYLHQNDCHFSIYSSIFLYTKSLIYTKESLYGFEFDCLFKHEKPILSEGSDGEHCVLSFFDLVFKFMLPKSIDIFVYTLLQNIPSFSFLLLPALTCHPKTETVAVAAGCSINRYRTKAVTSFPDNKLSTSRQTPSALVSLTNSNSPLWKTGQMGSGHKAESRVEVAIS